MTYDDSVPIGEKLIEGMREQNRELVKRELEAAWVSVLDRLPAPHDYVLTYCTADPIDIGYLSALGDGVWFRAVDDYPIDPTHWMPLPSPPTGECCDE